jgi:hypothetical protein
MAPQSRGLGAEPHEGATRFPVVELHRLDGGEVDLGALELSDSGAEDLTSFIRRPRQGELQHRGPHVSNLGVAA